MAGHSYVFNGQESRWHSKQAKILRQKTLTCIKCRMKLITAILEFYSTSQSFVSAQSWEPGYQVFELRMTQQFVSIWIPFPTEFITFPKDVLTVRELQPLWKSNDKYNEFESVRWSRDEAWIPQWSGHHQGEMAHLFEGVCRIQSHLATSPSPGYVYPNSQVARTNFHFVKPPKYWLLY